MAAKALQLSIHVDLLGLKLIFSSNISSLFLIENLLDSPFHWIGRQLQHFHEIRRIYIEFHWIFFHPVLPERQVIPPFP